MTTQPGSGPAQAVLIDDVEPEPLEAGISRRGLPSSGQVLARVFDLDPGVQWPVVDVHDRDELIYVISGEVLDHDRRFPAGTYLYYQAGSTHQPRTESGTRILVFGPSAP